MPDLAIRKHAANVHAHKLSLLSELFGCSFDLRRIRMLPFGGGLLPQTEKACGVHQLKLKDPRNKIPSLFPFSEAILTLN